ncbi:BREX-1 system adenine-specific DNA-methyltransferase PglX [Oceanobacillus locisalsi]|uniref:site-specific DNA-methyltransferase (adenine-specific) n=1 Tax=Oceanobacillus locisalsi TaxID=546107 RepID=A0ABW3NKX7_9BACI
MDKGAIKKFATSARKKLMEAVVQKAFELGITEGQVKEPEVYQDGFLINQKYYKQYEIKQREKLLQEIEQKGYGQVMEEVAYTWFNRFIALRFMEVNDYLPTGVRIFSSIESGKMEPDAMTEILMLVDDLDLDEKKVYELQDANDDEDLFKYILVKQCNKLGEMMPMMFEQIADYTELLLPNQLLAETSVIYDMVNDIAEDDWTQEVEIIGWLYQYYISEKKDEVFAALKKNQKISKENIPAATELFTPRWIVQYMVDNSLGRLWLESHPDKTLQEQLPYYLEAAEQPEHVVQQLEVLKDTNLKPESITFFDPCMGSGHILVYAFEVFYKLYQSQGYRGQDIPKLILENNLYGLDIDPRAAQLAYFSVMMKARSYNHRIFRSPIHTNIRGFEESNTITEQDMDIFVGDTDVREDVEVLINTFKDGKLFGSILEVPEIDFEALKERVHNLQEAELDDMFAVDFRDYVLPVVERLIDQGVILDKKYDVVVTNPPYLSSKGMDKKLHSFIGNKFPLSKMDLFSVFMESNFGKVKKTGFNVLVTMQNWMFLTSFEQLRHKLITEKMLVSLLHMENMVLGIAFGTSVSVWRNMQLKKYKSKFNYVQYKDVRDSIPKLHSTEEQTVIKEFDSFEYTPKNVVCYWISEKALDSYRNYNALKQYADVKKGISTSNDNKFLRLWFEVNRHYSSLNSYDSSKRWFPINKGGKFKRWFGNNEFVINWEENGYELKNLEKSVVRNEKYYFMDGITWTYVTNGKLHLRYFENACFAAVGPSIFSKSSIYLLGILNSKVGQYFADLVGGETITYEVGEIASIPIINDYKKKLVIEKLIYDNISISKADWDSFETSWDFKTHPFLEFQQETTQLSEAFTNWQQEAENRFQTLKANEEELNRIFINLYGLQDELTPDVEEKDVTVNRADQVRDVKSFFSYAVGLMFGRYSLDEEGLAFAGGEFLLDNYQTFQPDQENVIPITDDVYFEDDIVNRFITLLKTTFGEEHLEENLDFIADTLTRKASETSRQRIRRYFLKEFYKDHVQTYQKRPIYWLFDSGKQDGFKALVYLHRYQPGLVARVRTDYLHAQQRKYEDEMERIDMMLDSDISKQEQTRLKKQKEKLQKQLLECQHYDQLIAHIANQKIDLDLDDGVKVNYAKFQNIEIPQGEGKKPIEGNLLAKI